MKKAQFDEKTANQKLIINMAASFITYVVTFGISFFLSPYIVKTVGVDAYGFVGLANNFITYASLITVALNALAGRFITIKIHEKDYEGANRYYSSVFLSNCVLSLVLLILLTIIWVYLEQLINIPMNILWDVKILFAVLFINCIISTVSSVFGVATFATNKLYLSSFRSIESSVIRAIVLICLFALFTPKVSYLGITTLLVTLYCTGYNIYYTRKLLPFVHIRRSSFDFAAVKELLSAGVWNLIMRVGQIFTDGLDLLITNLLIDATAMGVLSLAKTVPSIITGIIGNVVGVFSPNFTILYAEKKMDELVKAVRQSMKIMGILTNLPIIVLVICGHDFFALWQPTQDALLLQMLSILTIGCVVISGGINCLYGIFTVVNRIKANSIAVIAGGLLSACITLILLKTTSLGILAVAGVSTAISIVRNLVFTVPYGAKCLGLKWYAFYPDIFRSVVFTGVCVFSLMPFSMVFSVANWGFLFIKGGVVSVFSIAVGAFVFLSRQERVMIKRKMRKWDKS